MAAAPAVPPALSGPAMLASGAAIMARYGTRGRAAPATGNTRRRCAAGTRLARRRLSGRQSANTPRARPKGFIGLIRKRSAT